MSHHITQNFIDEAWNTKDINLKDYTFAQERIDERFGLIYFMKSKVTVRTLFVKERNISILSPQYLEIATRSKISDNYLLQIHGIKQDINSNTIQIYFEEFPTDLQSEIQRHLTERTRFSEAELYAILYSSVSALSCLEQHNKPHNFVVPLNILKFRKDIYKIHDNFTISNQTYLYNQALRGQYLRYLAPEFLASLTRKSEKPDPYDAYKADIFSLGICILDAGLLTTEGDYINKKLMILDENALRGALQKFASLYSNTLAHILEDMLNQDPSKRPSPTTLFKRLPGKPLPQGQNSGKKRKYLDKIINDGSPEKREFTRNELFGSYGTPGRFLLDDGKDSRDYKYLERDRDIVNQQYKKSTSPDKSSVGPTLIGRNTDADISKVNVSTSIKNDPILSQFVKRLVDPVYDTRNSQPISEGNKSITGHSGSQPLTSQLSSNQFLSQEAKDYYSKPEPQEGTKSLYGGSSLISTQKISYPQNIEQNNRYQSPLNFDAFHLVSPPSQDTLKTYHVESFREQKEKGGQKHVSQSISQPYNYTEPSQNPLYEFEGQEDDKVKNKIDEMIAKALERSSTNLFLSQKVSMQISSTLNTPNKNDMKNQFSSGTQPSVNKLQLQKTGPPEGTNDKDLGNSSSLFNPKVVESSRINDSPLNVVEYYQKDEKYSNEHLHHNNSQNHYGGSEVNTPGFK